MAARLGLGILGPLVATGDGQRLKITSARQRVVLALLALFPDHVVTVDTMVDSIWPKRVPATARTQVSICVASLRRLFASVGAGESVIVTEFPGYRLDSSGLRIDRVVFEEEVARAEQAAREGDLAEAGRRYQQALGLWRGEALSGITGMVAENEAARLTERRLAVHDDAIAVQLELGHFDHALSAAVALVREHPLRERTVSLLMLAQYRSGRRADSLESFRGTRRTFVEELGMEPGPDLIKLHAAILRDDPALAPAPFTREREEAEVAEAVAVISPQPPAAFVVPSELPPDTHGFVGRRSELAALDSLSTLAEAGYGPTVGLITGVAGVGKTSLAVHWAHQAADRYPDGRLFADLRGYDESDMASAAEILSQFLRSLGVHGARIPESLAERAALYRSILNDRRVLVLLDNAGSFQQVRLLLPSNNGCTALITGREQLQSLVVAPSQARIRLGVLPQPEAVALLGAIVGHTRVSAAPEDAARIVEFCDQLPLAVRVAGARLASKPHWTIGRLADRLSDEGQRLDELSRGDARVRAGLELSYRHLEPDAALMYKTLGLLDVPDFTAWVGAALLGISLDKAEELIEQLVDMQLLEVVGADCTGWLRYRFQKLLRLYARERVDEGDSAEHDVALDRVMGGYLGLAAQAHQREYGGVYTVLPTTSPPHEADPELAYALLAQPLEWFESERRSLIAVVRQAANCGRGRIAWNLTMSMVSLFEVRNYIDDWQICCEYALAAAEAEGDVRGQACMLHDIGAVALRRRELSTAAEYFQRALELYTSIDEMRGRAMTLRSLAIVERLEGRLDLAEERLAEALPVLREVGDLSSEAHALNNLAQIALDRRTPERALALALEAVRASERIGPGGERNLAQSMHRLARAQLALEQWPQAAESFRGVIEIVEAKSDLVGLAYATFGLAETRLAADDRVAALAGMVEALELTRQIDSPLLEGQIMLAMSGIERRRGDRDRAEDLLTKAHGLFERIGSTRWRLRAEELRTAVPAGPPASADGGEPR